MSIASGESFVAGTTELGGGLFLTVGGSLSVAGLLAISSVFTPLRMDGGYVSAGTFDFESGTIEGSGTLASSGTLSNNDSIMADTQSSSVLLLTPAVYQREV